MGAGRWLETFAHDVAFALRQLRRAPAFTAVAITTLALGFGVNSAIFALVDMTLLRPLPLPAPDRLVTVWGTSETTDRGAISPLNLLDFNARSQTMERMAGYVNNVGGMVMAGRDGVAETVPRQWVGAEIFNVLGLQPVVGRNLSAADEAARLNVVVMNESFWRSRFDADPSVVGREIRLDGEPFTIVGVVPDEAQLIGKANLWAVAQWNPANPRMRFPRVLTVVGRMKPGVTFEAASAEMSAVASGLAAEFPDANAGRGVRLEPLRDVLIGGELRLTSMLFLGVVGFVLLICCANVANLLLARATVRSRELAVRTAIGATPRRLVRQLLTESVVLSLAGGAIGLAAGAALLRAAPAIVPAGVLPDAVELTFDWRVASFCAVAALVVGVLFGLAPAWQARHLSPVQVGNSRTTTGRGGRVRSLLVTGAVAAATLLLCGAGLLLRTLLAVDNVDRGYRADRILTMLVDPLGSEYPTEEALLQFYDSVEQEVRALPGVASAGWASTLPLGTSYAGPIGFEVQGAPPVDPASLPTADYQIVSHTYFETVDLPIVDGRAFTDRDRANTPPVAIVNEAFAERYLVGRSPIGARIVLRSSPTSEPQVREVVGVAKQVKERPDEDSAFLQVYVPLTQSLIGDIFLLVRPASGRAEALTPAVRAAIGRIDRAQLVSIRDIMTLDDVADGATSGHRFRAVLVMMFAGLALVLAMVGVFGILAGLVQQRVREIGLRMALGAGMRDVLGMVAWHAARLVGAGVVIGLALAAMLGRLLASVLFGVTPLDPATFAMTVGVLLVTGLIAVAAPAWRASRVDPAIAMRAD